MNTRFGKKIIVFSLAFGFLFGGTGISNVKAAEEDPLYLEGDFLAPDPVTNTYSSDWSHLDNEENFKLQKDVQAFHKKIEKKFAKKNKGTEGVTTYQLNESAGEDVSLTEEELKEVEALHDRIEKFYHSVDPTAESVMQSKSTLVSTYALYDPFENYYSKLIEAEMHLAKGVLSPSQLAAAFENSQAAKKHATNYAEARGWYASNGDVKTWDNASDALRHFAWNYMNSHDMGTGKARLVGDVHELALVGVGYMDQAWACGVGIECKTAYAAVKANQAGYAAQGSLSTFVNTFDNASVMDLLNNSQGRKAFVNGYDNYSEPFNILLKSGTLIQFPSWINVNKRYDAWLGFQ